MKIVIDDRQLENVKAWMRRYFMILTLGGIALASGAAFLYYAQNGLGVAYNDARSHLDIGRRVVEGLKPGLAQIGSVWLPLLHLLMVPTIWNDWMWHTGLSGALVSMISYVATTGIIMLYLRRLSIGRAGQLVGALVFAFNLNVIYLQSTAMTELLLMATMTAAAYSTLRWYQTDELIHLIGAALFTMLATLTRYDGWFLAVYIAGLVAIKAWKSKGLRAAEGLGLLYLTLAGFGIVLWFGWNVAIFGDPLYFIFGPYSARAQQKVIESAGMLRTKGDWGFSLFTYTYTMILSIGIVPTLLGIAGLTAMSRDNSYRWLTKLAVTALLAPYFFNVLALYLGQSAIFLQGISAETWFNVRYGVLIMPAIAICIGYLAGKHRQYLPAIATGLILVMAVSWNSHDAIAIDDATVGSSQKNVSEVASWLRNHAGNEDGFIMISAASHDAVLFSSELPMKRFIHEGTGKYWENAGRAPDRWAKWLVMRTNDVSDSTFSLTQASGQLHKYDLVQSYPFADIYQLKAEFWAEVNTQPILGKQK